MMNVFKWTKTNHFMQRKKTSTLKINNPGRIYSLKRTSLTVSETPVTNVEWKKIQTRPCKTSGYEMNQSHE